MDKTQDGVKQSPSPFAWFFFVFAAFVIVVAGLKVAATVVNPFLLSIFITILCVPLVNWLVQKGVGSGLAIILVVIGILGVAALMGALVGQSLNDFSQQMPTYEASLKAQMSRLIERVSESGVQLEVSGIAEYFDPAVAMKLAANTLSGLGSVLTNFFLILLTVMFMLAEALSLPRKIRKALTNPEASLSRFEIFATGVKHYLMIKTVVSAATGGLVVAILWALDVDFPILWGLLAFMMNYIPNIGSILAAVPAVLLALVQHGPLIALFVIGGYAFVNIFMGNVIEPRYMGKGLGLSTLVVFLSLVFWGWILGPVGMLLSIPLTMVVKIALESSEDTRWLGVMLGPS